MASSPPLAFDRTMTAPAARLTPRELLATQHTMAFVGDAADAAPSLATGTTVSNRYNVRRRLGRGGMGEVYEAQDVALGENVALKTLRAGLSGASVDQFRQEAQLARRVTHVNVCRIHDIGHHEGVDFLTMELLEGETLSARLDRKGRLTTEEAHALLNQICAGVNAAHEAGIVHRDLKCGNIMIAPGVRGERAVITDFGLALMAGVTPGSIAGSPAYMAPEQVEGGEVGPAADLYALGVIMFEMVTGKLPFVGDTAEQTARKRLDTPPPSPRTIAPDVDARWERAIMRCLARKPEDRFPDAPSVLAAVTAPEKRPTTRWRWVVTGVAFASAIGLALLAPAFRSSSPPGGPTVAASASSAPSSGPPAPPAPPVPGVAPSMVPPVIVDPGRTPRLAVPMPPLPPAPPDAEARLQAAASRRAAQRDRDDGEAAHAQALQEWALRKAAQPDEPDDEDHDSSHADDEEEAHDKAREKAQEARDQAQEEAEARAAAQEAVKDPDVQEILNAGVRRRGPGRVEVDVRVIQTVAQDTDVLIGSTRVSTATRAGKTIGLSLEDVGPGTLLAHLGFRSGDIITSVAGASVASSNDARRALDSLRDVQHVTVEFIRHGKPQKLDIGLSLTPPR